jgi:hypothetical protein
MSLINEQKVFSTAFLMGGLGNQMFQISNALSQGWKNNVPTFFKCDAYTPMQAFKPKKYVDNIFRNIKFLDFSLPVKRVSAPWEYTELKLDWSSPIEFYGFFQSSKNFSEYKDRIIELFSPPDLVISELYSKYPELNFENTLSIHIRRGDCFQNPDIHPMPTVQYIEKCLDIIGEYSHVLIFTDDKIWVKENLKFENCTYIDDEDYNEMWIMSLCKNNIISNSTFSWWGSFLNKNKNKKVIAPSIWFGPRGPQNYKDIYEDNWTVVDVNYNNGFFE